MNDVKRSAEAFDFFDKHYWEYFLELESEFLSTRKYVDFSEGNYSTYSIEFLKLFQAICSEIDVVGKMMASYYNPSFNPTGKDVTLYKWWYEIQDVYFLSEEEFTPMNPSIEPTRFKMTDYKCLMLDRIWLNPWNLFRVEKKNKTYYLADASEEPQWWKDYNGVKHNRLLFDRESSKYHLANLENVMQSFSALYILEKSFMDSVGEANDLQAFADFSKLFVRRKAYTNEEMDMLVSSVFG